MEKEIRDYFMYLNNDSVIVIENDKYENQKEKYQQYQKTLDHEPEE